MSLRYGMRYSWYLGRESEPGRYRFTRNRTSASGMSVLPFDGLPPRDRHGGVVDARRAVRAVGERVLQIVRIVARWIIGATVRAPRLPAVPRAVRDRRRDVEHEVELEDRREFRVEHPVLVRQADVGEAIAQFGKLLARLDEAGLLPEDPDVPVHELLHLDADPGEGLLPALSPQEAVEDARLFRLEGRARRRGARVAGALLRELGHGPAGPRAEDEALAQAVRAEAVRPVDRDARRLADGVEAGDVRLAPRVRRHAAHHVVLARPHGDRLADRVEAHVLLHQLADHRELAVDRRLAEVAKVEAEILAIRAVERAARLHLLDHRAREDVPRAELHLARKVALHVPFARLVDQVAALAPRGLRDQDAGARQTRRMELDHLHVLQRHARAVSEGHAVARLDESVRREFVHTAAPARREDGRLRADRDHAASPEVDRRDADARAAVEDQRRHEVLVEALDLRELHRGLEERVEDVESDLVRREDGALDGHPAERPLAHAPVGIAGPRAAPMLEPDDLLRTLRDEELDSVLVREEVGAFDRVRRVELEGVVVPHHRGGPALRRDGVAPHRVDLRDEGNRDLGVLFGRSDRRPQARGATADHHDVVGGPFHGLRESSPENKRCAPTAHRNGEGPFSRWEGLVSAVAAVVARPRAEASSSTLSFGARYGGHHGRRPG